MSRRNTWQPAECGGDAWPWRQHLLDRSRWDAEAVWDFTCRLSPTPAISNRLGVLTRGALRKRSSWPSPPAAWPTTRCAPVTAGTGTSSWPSRPPRSLQSRTWLPASRALASEYFRQEAAQPADHTGNEADRTGSVPPLRFTACETRRLVIVLQPQPQPQLQPQPPPRPDPARPALAQRATLPPSPRPPSSPPLHHTAPATLDYSHPADLRLKGLWGKRPAHSATGPG
jgi:hypothetical protein